MQITNKKGIIRLTSLVLVAIILALAFTGCRIEHYEDDEIAEWAKENFDTPVVISDDYFTRPSGEDGKWEDRVWTAYLKDMPEIQFEIISHEFYGMESIDHSIVCTYKYEYGKYLFSQCDPELQAFFEHHKDDERYSGYHLRGLFSDRQELTEMITKALRLEEYMEEQGASECIRFVLAYDDVLAEVDDTDVFAYACGTEAIKAAEKELEEEFVLYAADYRLALDQFTYDELVSAVSVSDQRFVVTRADGSQVSYPDLALSCFGYGMSFGSLYEVLAREGFPVAGIPEEFSVIGVSGDVYEFSYSFNDMPFENGKNGYYYIRNGSSIPMSYYFYNHINNKLFEEISGMTFEKAE